MRRLPFFWTAALALVALMTTVAPLRAQDAIPTASGTSDAYIEASVDDASPWLGQQVTYLFRYYEAVDSGNLPSWIRPPDYEAPEFSGFWVEGEPQVSSSIQELNGRTYNVAELRTVLFPTSAGTVVVPPAKLILYDLFADGERVLETLPVPLEVQALPADAPPGFDGAVGDLRLEAQVDRPATPVGEPIQLRLTLTGLGNLALAPAPTVRDLPGWRLLAGGSDALTEVTDGQAGGTRTFDFLLIPAAPGSVTLPPIQLAYFDPAAGEYRTAQTQPIVLTAEGVAPTITAAVVVTSTTTTTQSAALLTAGATSSTAEAKLPSGAAALVLRTAEELPMQRRALTQNPLYWALWLLPAMALVIGVGARRRSPARAQARHAAHAAARSRARAGSEVLGTLAPPAAFAGPAEATAAAQQALTDFLQRRLGQTVAGLSRAALGGLLVAHGARSELAERTVALLRQGDQIRYAPPGLDWPAAQAMHAAVTAVIRELDPVLR